MGLRRRYRRPAAGRGVGAGRLRAHDVDGSAGPGPVALPGLAVAVLLGRVRRRRRRRRAPPPGVSPRRRRLGDRHAHRCRGAGGQPPAGGEPGAARRRQRAAPACAAEQPVPGRRLRVPRRPRRARHRAAGRLAPPVRRVRPGRPGRRRAVRMGQPLGEPGRAVGRAGAVVPVPYEAGDLRRRPGGRVGGGHGHDRGRRPDRSAHRRARVPVAGRRGRGRGGRRAAVARREHPGRPARHHRCTTRAPAPGADPRPGLQWRRVALATGRCPGARADAGVGGPIRRPVPVDARRRRRPPRDRPLPGRMAHPAAVVRRRLRASAGRRPR